MNPSQVLLWALANRALPTPFVGDNVNGPLRSSRYGEPIAQLIGGSRIHALADEGSYFVATNPTPGTAIAGTTTPTAFSETVGLLSVFNGNTASGNSAKQIYLDFILLQVVAVGTSSTNYNLTGKVDAGPNRWSSGGSAITPVSPNMNSSAKSGAVINFGALVLASATTSARLVHNHLVRSVIPVANDYVLLTFGTSVPQGPGMPTDGTLQCFSQLTCPPVVIGAQQNYYLNEWAASQSAARTYQFTVGYWER
jgi:hypothetical protein